MTDIFEGSIIRSFRRLQELLRQMGGAARAIGNSDLETKFDDAIKLLERPNTVVFNPSYVNSRHTTHIPSSNCLSGFAVGCISRNVSDRCSLVYNIVWFYELLLNGFLTRSTRPRFLNSWYLA